MEIFNPPSTLTHVRFGKYYDKPLTCLLSRCTNITHLTLGFDYNQSLPLLPQSLKYLILRALFSYPLNNTLSQCNLTHFVLGDCFNQLLSNLPQTITYLQLGDEFD
eukprot:TRINITY_DN15760_c0_g1_i1.p2 TRINITY_DN15760_c0_g1~~TRINITY_DN15760_c0_g1_i1.p2  ORF type:complete len:106 (-),score=16.27 TRINITY_DN15760_c0_g1_i1:625-942(-)